jgi:arylsulfatase A-like enzyme
MLSNAIRIRTTLACVLAWTISFTACSGESAAPPDVILIVVDTLRADHLGCYGYDRYPVTPNIDAFSKNGTVFERVVVPIARTTQSVSSILTGQYPRNHGVRNLRDKLPGTVHTLPEILQETGYDTIAVQANAVLEGMVDQGFDKLITKKYFAGGVATFDAQETTQRALALIDTLADSERPMFLYVLYADPHMPYKPKHLLYDHTYQGKFKDYLPYRMPVGRQFFYNDMSAREREHAVALYDSEIHAVDTEIGRLLAALDKRKRERVVVITADHGESLGENNTYFDHGTTIHDAELRVPLIIEGGGFGAGRVDRLVSTIDIVPSLLTYLGIEWNTGSIDGRDLHTAAAWEKGKRSIFSETGTVLHQEAYTRGLRAVEGISGRHRAVTRGKWRVILRPLDEGRALEYYDLEADPEQRRNLYGTPQSEELADQLLRWNTDLDSDTPATPLNALDRERLRALGYL